MIFSIFGSKGVTVSGDTISTTTEGMALADNTIRQAKHWEVLIVSDPYLYSTVGIAQPTTDINNFVGADPDAFGWYTNSALITAGNPIMYLVPYGVGDKLTFSLSENVLEFGKNGIVVGTMAVPKGAWYPALGASSGGQTVQTFTKLKSTGHKKLSLWQKIKKFFS